MSRWFYIVFVFIIIGCDDNENFFEGPFHVRFTETTLTHLESYSPVIPISVHIVGPQPDSDVDIYYRIEGSARIGVDYQILGDDGVVVIPRGESFGFIEVQLINNSNNILESQQLEIVLESVSSDELDIGFGPGVKAGKNFTLTIIDDCILGGSYTLSNQDNDAIEGIHVTSKDCIKYLLENWDIGVFNFADVRNLTFTDNGDNTVNIPEQEEATLPSDLATIRGSGVVNPITREIILNIELVDFEDSPVVTINLKPE